MRALQGEKTKRKKRRRQWPQRFGFFNASAFLLSGHSATRAAQFVPFYAIRSVTENDARQSEHERNFTISVKYYNRLATIFRILLFSSSNLSLLYTSFPNAESELLVNRHVCLCPPSVLGFFFFPLLFSLLEQEDECRVKAHPP